MALGQRPPIGPEERLCGLGELFQPDGEPVGAESLRSIEDLQRGVVRDPVAGVGVLISSGDARTPEEAFVTGTQALLQTVTERWWAIEGLDTKLPVLGELVGRALYRVFRDA